MKIEDILFMSGGMGVDTILLYYFMNYHRIKINKQLLIIPYILYFIVVFLLGIVTAPIWIRILYSIIFTILIGHFVYKGLKKWELLCESLVFILLLGISELLILPIVFITTGISDINIFSDSGKPVIWGLSLSVSRIITLGLIILFRRIQLRQNKKMSIREHAIVYLPLIVSFASYLVMIRFLLGEGSFTSISYIKMLSFIGLTFLVLTLIHMILVEKYIQYRNKNSELLMLKQKNSLQYEYYKNQIEASENIRFMYHDLKNHLLVSTFDLDYLERVKNNLCKYEKFSNTGCSVLDILLWEKYNVAAKNKIQFEKQVEQIDFSFIDDYDICSIVGNLLDNAIEACRLFVSALSPEIEIKIVKIQDFIMIKIVNDCIEVPLKNCNRKFFKSSKTEGSQHGIGMESISYAVDKYNGNYEFEYHDNKFYSEVLIPIPIKQ